MRDVQRWLVVRSGRMLFAGFAALAVTSAQAAGTVNRPVTVTPFGKYEPPIVGTNPPSRVPTNAAETELMLKRALRLEQTGPDTFKIGQVTFDKQARTVTVPARLNMRQGLIEYALVTETGKRHESLFTTDARPDELQLAFLLLGMQPGGLRGGGTGKLDVPATNAVMIEVTWEKHGPPARYGLFQLIALRTPGSEARVTAMLDGPWFFSGSQFGPMGFAAQAEGSFVSLIGDPSALLNNPRDDRFQDDLHVPNSGLLPPDGVPVRILFRLPDKARPEPDTRK